MKVWRIIGFTLLHFACTLVAFGMYFALGMGRFDTGAPPTWIEYALEACWKVLALPLAFPVMYMHLWPWDDFPLGHVPFILNSLMWGFAFNWWWMRRKRKTLAKKEVARYH
jgi:hypothetical protein